MNQKNIQSRIFNSAHPLTNLEIQRYYQNEPRSNGVYSRDNPPKTQFNDKIKDETYARNLDEYSDIGTHWISLYALNNEQAHSKRNLKICWK